MPCYTGFLHFPCYVKKKTFSAKPINYLLYNNFMNLCRLVVVAVLMELMEVILRNVVVFLGKNYFFLVVLTTALCLGYFLSVNFSYPGIQSSYALWLQMV